jgi:hypothetical protein
VESGGSSRRLGALALATAALQASVLGLAAGLLERPLLLLSAVQLGAGGNLCRTTFVPLVTALPLVRSASPLLGGDEEQRAQHRTSAVVGADLHDAGERHADPLGYPHGCWVL